MRVLYSWLRELTGLDWSPEEMAERLTLCGLSCEEVIHLGRNLDRVVVGEVIELHPVEGASKIQRAVVSVGEGRLDIVCGAPNVAVGQKVPVALEGARLEGGLEIRRARIRGVESAGMICSEAELGLSTDHSGIMVLDGELRPGTPLMEALDLDDYVFDLEITPNRGDAWSLIGVARDLAAVGGVTVRRPEFTLNESGVPAAETVSVEIEDPRDCPRFTARIIREVTVTSSPWWVRKRLLACGVRPINNVVDVTNLVMLETGNPIHAFDLGRFGSDRVLVRRARDGETLVTLDGQERKLTPEVLLITDGARPRAAAGVMGGEDSEVTLQTTDILLEVAYFTPSVIRKSRRALGIISEASHRFERGVDPNNVPFASARAAALFAELCGATPAPGYVDCYPEPIRPVTVSLRPDRCNRILGTALSVDRMRAILTGLEFDVGGQGTLEVTVPTFRHDITREIDLIEEVARIEGYDKIPDADRSIGPLFTPIHWRDRCIDELRQVMTGAGFDEIVGHGLADGNLADRLHPDLPRVRILNPVSEDLNIVRNSLVVGALPVVAHNVAHREVNLRLFEIGKAYFPPADGRDWYEELRLLVAVTGQTDGDWRTRPRPLDFYDVSGALQLVARHFHAPAFSFRDEGCSWLETAGSFAVYLGDRAVGYAGLVKQDLCRRLDIKQPVWLAEISIMPFIEGGRREVAFEPLPAFPAAPRDLALVIEESVRVEEVLRLVRETAGELAERVDVFDLYTGKQVGEGRKSVGISIVYRVADRSLTGEEIDAVQARILAVVKDKLGAEVRDA